MAKSLSATDMRRLLQTCCLNCLAYNTPCEMSRSLRAHALRVGVKVLGAPSSCGTLAQHTSTHSASRSGRTPRQSGPCRHCMLPLTPPYYMRMEPRSSQTVTPPGLLHPLLRAVRVWVLPVMICLPMHVKGKGDFTVMAWKH